MLSTREATSADDAAIAALWTASAADPTSWIAAPLSAEQVAASRAAGMVWHLAEDEGLKGAAVGRRFGTLVQLLATADSAAPFYAVLDAASSHWLAPGGAATVFFVCRAGALRERAWLDALEVTTDTAIGREPGDEQTERAPLYFQLVAPMATLHTAAHAAEG